MWSSKGTRRSGMRVQTLGFAHADDQEYLTYFTVSSSIVVRLMSPTWNAFLANPVKDLGACDFFTIRGCV